MMGMRAAFLGVLAWVAGCDARHGSYLVIDGAPQKIMFDRVELYFGLGGAPRIPTTPKTMAMSNPRVGRRFTRQFGAADTYAIGESRDVLDYYLPADPQNPRGDYVAVVAFAGDTPVGVGELFDYEIPETALYQYAIELAPFASEDVEVWGDGVAPSCLRWQRARAGGPPTIAVVRQNDKDCDAVIGKLDCEDFAYCTTASCTAAPLTCFAQDHGDCIYGSCVDGVGCVASTCTIPGACATECEVPELAPRLDCARNVIGLDHVEYAIPVVADQGQLHLICDPYTFKFAVPSATGPVACALPALVAPMSGIEDGYQYAIAPSNDPETTCTVTVRPVPGPVVSFDHTPDRHLLIEIQATGVPAPVAGRWSLLIGLKAGAPQPPLCDSNVPLLDAQGTGDVMTCEP